ncbi:hypothetical protein [Amnibacterium endophyticum]|uniref:SGNH hydrolase-type esterase domain-containing protein n=1 Tax=Amnibacterium endophyticum TaxID=2109337 RepID=A0ABW4LGU4_9MICO
MTAFEVHASGATVEASGHVGAMRVLIVGSGITTGWGVQTHSLALMGSLRRALQARMERPVDIEQLSEVGATMSRANELLGTRATDRWDAIVVAFGLSDAMRLTRTSSWVRATSRLMAKLDSDMPDGLLVPIAVVGIPPTDLLGALRTLLPLRRLIARHAVRLNELTAQTVARNRRAVFVPMPGMVNSSSRPTGSPEAYAAWAEVIAAGLQERLAEQRSDRSAEILDDDLLREAAEVLERLAMRSAEDDLDPSRSAEPPPRGSRRRASGWLAELSTRRGRRSLLRTEGRALTQVPTARAVPEESEVRVPGSDPIRVLLVGGEYSIGFGAASRADALDGALARLLHVRTGRGVIVENRAQHSVRLHQLAGSLGPAGAHTFDLVVWTPTFIEAATMLLRSRWTAGIELMLRRIESTSDAGVVLVGVPRLLGMQPLAVLGRSRAAQIARLLRRIADRHDQVLVAEPPPVALQDVDAADGPAVYREAAAELLPVVLELLERRADRGRDAAPQDALLTQALEPALH